MKYAVKVTRDTRDGQITVHPVTSVPDDTEGYRLKHSAYWAEGLQIFDSVEDAREAAAAEKECAEYHGKTNGELRELLLSARTYLAGQRISMAQCCRWTGIDYHRVADYMCRGVAPNPRVVVKVQLLARAIAREVERAGRILPIEGGCGNPRKGRGGRPDIWKDSPSRKTTKN